MKPGLLPKIISLIIAVPIGLLLGLSIIYGISRATGDETVLGYLAKIGFHPSSQTTATQNSSTAGTEDAGKADDKKADNGEPADDENENGNGGGVDWLEFVADKIDSIVVPKPPLDGNLSVARDIRGTWKSSLKGKGLQVFGVFNEGGGTVKVVEEGDFEVVIEAVKGNTASGKMRLSNMYTWGSATLPKIGTSKIPRMLVVKDSGYSPMQARVSGTMIDFGSFSMGGASGSMRGTFTTDLMEGWVTIQTEQGPLKGTFHLIRQK